MEFPRFGRIFYMDFAYSGGLLFDLFDCPLPFNNIIFDGL